MRKLNLPISQSSPSYKGKAIIRNSSIHRNYRRSIVVPIWVVIANVIVKRILSPRYIGEARDISRREKKLIYKFVNSIYGFSGRNGARQDGNESRCCIISKPRRPRVRLIAGKSREKDLAVYTESQTESPLS